MKITQCLPLVFITVLAGLGSCQRNAQVSSEGKTLSNQVKGGIQPVHEVAENISTKTVDTVKESANYDTIPFRFLPLSEQLKRSQPFHQYGRIKLKRYDPEPTHYSFTNEEEGYMIIENYPGVLHYRYVPSRGRLSKPYTCYKLEFYDPVTGKYRKSIDLIKESPYNKDNYPIVGYGYPAMEDFIWESWARIYPDGEKVFYDILNKNEKCYLTVNNVNARPNGFTIVEYQLIEMSKKAGGPLNWEETLVVFDSLGKETGRLEVPNDTGDAWCSDDGRFLVFIYGGPNSDNPHDFDDGGVKIYDFKEEKIVFHKTNKEECVIFRGVGMGNLNYLDIPSSELLSISTFYTRDDYARSLFILDFKNQCMYKTSVDRSKWETLETTPMVNLLHKLTFIKQPFEL